MPKGQYGLHQVWLPSCYRVLLDHPGRLCVSRCQICHHALFFLSLMVHTLCRLLIPHLSYYFRYCKPTKETQTNNDILRPPGAWGDTGQMLWALGEASLLKRGLALAMWVSISLCHFALGTRDCSPPPLLRSADISFRLYLGPFQLTSECCTISPGCQMVKGSLSYWTGQTGQYGGSANFRDKQETQCHWFQTLDLIFFTLPISGKDIYGQRLTIHHFWPSLRRAWQLLPWDYRNFSFSSKSVMLQTEYKPDWGLVVNRNAV